MANFTIMRNGLNTEIVGDPHIGQSSEDVTVTVTDDGTYQEYDKKLYYSYVYRNQVYRAIADENSSNEFVIPMTAFLEPGIVKLSLELSNGTNKPTCNACFIIATNGAKSVAASDILPDDAIWEQYVASYVKEHSEEFKGNKGDKGEKGDPGSISNLKIGGVNLLNESSLLKAPSNDTNWRCYVQNDATSKFVSEGLKVNTSKSGNQNNGFVIIMKNANSVVKPGEKVTFSVDLKGNNINLYLAYMYQGDKNFIWGNVITSKTHIDKDKIDDFIRVSFSFVMPDVGTKNKDLGILLKQGNKKDNCEIIYRNAKLEREETPTDWTPSPKDYERNTVSYANMESTTASHSYSVGDFLEANGSLKKVTLAIAQGQEINVSNTVDTTITDELKAIYALINK